MPERVTGKKLEREVSRGHSSCKAKGQTRRSVREPIDVKGHASEVCESKAIKRSHR